MVACCTSNAADWAQFLRPKRNSTSSETGLLRSWPKSWPEVLWTVAIGKGYGGPVVKNGNVYLLKHEFDQGFNSSPILAGYRVHLITLPKKTYIIKAVRQFESPGGGDIGESVDATPAFVGERLYIRGLAYVFCIGEGPKSGQRPNQMTVTIIEHFLADAVPE